MCYSGCKLFSDPRLLTAVLLSPAPRTESPIIVFICFIFFLKQIVCKIPVFRFPGDVHFSRVLSTVAGERHGHRGMYGSDLFCPAFFSRVLSRFNRGFKRF